MGLLDGFEQISNPEIPYVSFSKFGINFTTLALECLSWAENVHVFVDRKNKKFAIQPCEKDDSSLTLVNPHTKHPHSIRWTSVDLNRNLIELGKLNIEDGLVKVPGKYYEEENVLIFDLTKPEKATARGGRRREKD